MQQVQTLEHTTRAVKNKNEKLQRVLIEKEASLLELQSHNAKLQAEVKSGRESAELGEAKLRAL